MKSIRFELTSKLLIGILLSIGLSAFLLNTILRDVLVSRFDEANLSAARELMVLVESLEDGSVEFDLQDRDFLHATAPAAAEEYFQVWLGDGMVLGRSPSLKGSDLPFKAISGDAPEYWDLKLPDGGRGRAVSIEFEPRSEVDPEDITADWPRHGGRLCRTSRRHPQRRAPATRHLPHTPQSPRRHLVNGVTGDTAGHASFPNAGRYTSFGNLKRH